MPEDPYEPNEPREPAEPRDDINPAEPMEPTEPPATTAGRVGCALPFIVGAAVVVGLVLLFLYLLIVR